MDGRPGPNGLPETRRCGGSAGAFANSLSGEEQRFADVFGFVALSSRTVDERFLDIGQCDHLVIGSTGEAENPALP